MIPNELRKKYRLRAGDKVALVDYGGVLSIVPAMTDPVAEAAGSLKGDHCVNPRTSGGSAPRNALVKGDLPRYVLDSFGLLAYFGGEPGEAQVKSVLERAAAEQADVYLSVVNLGEVVYIIEREQGASATRRALAAVDQLPIKLIEADRRMALAAAHVKAHHPISYADAFAVALAQQMQATILTGDPEFGKIEHLVAVEWLPQA